MKVDKYVKADLELAPFQIECWCGRIPQIHRLQALPCLFENARIFVFALQVLMFSRFGGEEIQAAHPKPAKFEESHSREEIELIAQIAFDTDIENASSVWKRVLDEGCDILFFAKVAQKLIAVLQVVMCVVAFDDH